MTQELIVQHRPITIVEKRGTTATLLSAIRQVAGQTGKRLESIVAH